MSDHNLDPRKSLLQNIWKENSSNQEILEPESCVSPTKPCRAAQHLGFQGFGEDPVSSWKNLLAKEGKLTVPTTIDKHKNLYG
jgi:hypothetical protein